ncbi:MAG: aminopeptidase P family N-terminal domain-containing protein, partial [Fimbriimonadaceae bacterium]|nr:aminopeptidase P family N-terminal domain-containing protein [Alphaproteobacteria bacterium]
MYQTYEDSGGPHDGKKRAALLRAELKTRGLDGFLVPHADEYQSEYLPPAAERLAWLTGFTGSAGFAILLHDAAYLFVDGRYTIQARQQSDTDIFTQKSLVTEPPSKWLKENLKPGLKIGYDPRMHTVQGAKTLREACEKAGSELIALDNNPLDTVWADRPAPPAGPVSIQSLEFAGETAASKLARIDEKLEQSAIDALLLTLSDSIAWTFNIRGSDIAHNPAPLCTAILRRKAKPSLVMDPRKLTDDTRGYLEDFCQLHDPAQLDDLLADLGALDLTIQLDPNSA